jgi:hypothetical protein
VQREEAASVKRGLATSAKMRNNNKLEKGRNNKCEDEKQ